jgi:hypothetical protein
MQLEWKARGHLRHGTRSLESAVPWYSKQLKQLCRGHLKDKTSAISVFWRAKVQFSGTGSREGCAEMGREASGAREADTVLLVLLSSTASDCS